MMGMGTTAVTDSGKDGGRTEQRWPDSSHDDRENDKQLA